MCAGTRDDGSTITPNDPFWDTRTAAAKAARSNPQAWLDQPALYGDLATNPRFADAFKTWLVMIWENGTDKALRKYAEG